MGKSSETIAASTGGGGSGEAHNVGSRPQEDFGVPEGEVGEVKGGAEEGGLAASFDRDIPASQEFDSHENNPETHFGKNCVDSVRACVAANRGPDHFRHGHRTQLHERQARCGC